MRIPSRLAALLALAIVTTASADWPRFMGPTGDGIAPEKEKITVSESPKELWRRPLAGGFSSAAIANGKVYVLDRPGGGAKEEFSVLDLATGKPEWTVSSDSSKIRDNFGTTRGTPAIDGDTAYTIGITGDLLAIDLKEKKIAWKKNIGKDFGAKPGGWGFAMSPVVLRDLLIVDTPGSGKSGVVALDKKTGEVKWQSPSFGPGGGGDTYTTPVVTTINKVEQLVSWHKGTCAGIATADGKLLWKYDWRTDRPIPNPVDCGNGRFFLTIGYGGGCAMIDIKPAGEGFEVKELFRDDRTASKVSPAIFYKGHIYTNASDHDQGLQCFDVDGKLKWKGTQKFELGSMIIADGKILMMNGRDGTLYFIEADPEKYAELGKAKLLDTKQVWAPIALSDGKLVIRDQQTMKCFDLTAK